MLAAVGLAAGTLVGCQSTGQQFAQPGVARGDLKSPVSPAFAQIEAGRQMTNGSGRMSPQMVMQQPMMASHHANQRGIPALGSGGIVYPVANVGNGQPHMQQQMMTMQGMPQQMMPMQQMQQPIIMTMQASPGMLMPAPAGQPIFMIVNGPNGPQYVQVDSVLPAPSSPVSMTVPMAPGQVIGLPAPEPAPAQGRMPATPAAPTFTAPPPAFVPTPTPAPAPIEMSSKSPKNLATSVSAKSPTGLVLPANDTAGPTLGTFPAAPAVAPSAANVLPQPNAVSSDDFIPSAPVFLPPGR